MADFNQGLHLGEALQRCHMIDDEGPRVDRGADRLLTISRRLRAQLTAEMKDPDPR